jgi:glycosyltransferase involved in cell wall biosynthesis
MRVLWTHNFNPAAPNSGLFMNIAAPGLRARGIELELEYLGNLRSVSTLMKARKRLRKMAGSFDLVHAQYGSACALATSVMSGVPKVLSLRGNDWNLYRASFGFHWFHTRLARAMTSWSLGSFDHVLTVSRRVAEDVRRSSPAASVSELPTPIDLERFVPLDRKEARRLLGFPDNTEKWVLFNAMDLQDPIKRFPLARQAFELANGRCGNLRLRVATNLPHKEIPLFTAACDVILCTSETEGWPNSIKEALACNVPFVSTDVSDLMDIARDEPSCRVCPDDPRVLAEALCGAVSSPAPADLRKHVASMRLDAVSDRLASVYASLTAGARSGDGRGKGGQG